MFSCLLSLLLTSQGAVIPKGLGEGEFFFIFCLKTRRDKERVEENEEVRGVRRARPWTQSFPPLFSLPPPRRTLSVLSSAPRHPPIPLPLSLYPFPPPLSLVSSFVFLTFSSSLVVLLRDRRRCEAADVAASRSSAVHWPEARPTQPHPPTSHLNKVRWRAYNPSIWNPNVWADFLLADNL